MTAKTYEDGVRDGEFTALKQTVGSHDKRLDAHAQRLQRVERLVYAVVGAWVLYQSIPKLLTFVGAP